jgi:hypothetical protein
MSSQFFVVRSSSMLVRSQRMSPDDYDIACYKLCEVLIISDEIYHTLSLLGDPADPSITLTLTLTSPAALEPPA